MAHLANAFKSRRDADFVFEFKQFDYKRDGYQVWEVSEKCIGKNGITMQEFEEIAAKENCTCIVAFCDQKVAGFFYAYVGERDQTIMKEFNLNVLADGIEPLLPDAGVNEAVQTLIAKKRSQDWIDTEFKSILAIRTLGVHPDFQMHGLGRELIIRVLYDLVYVRKLQFQVCSTLGWYMGIGADPHSAKILRGLGMQEVTRRDEYWKTMCCQEDYVCPLKDIEDFQGCRCGAALFVAFESDIRSAVEKGYSESLINSRRE
jgi:GNAT superfamily N-acetyltransferase